MEVLSKIGGVLLVLALLAIVMGFPTMWLWNWLVPKIFGLISIGFWESVGLNLLAGILFRTSNPS